MTSAHYKRTGRFTEGEINRQLALDYINSNPGCAGPQITAALGWEKSTCAVRMTRMTDDGDVTREITQYAYMNKAGFMCNVTTYAYHALRVKTRTAGEVCREVTRNLPNPNPSSYKHIPGKFPGTDHPEGHPLRQQEGIGSGRRRVYVGSTVGMI